jgi:hypothetical protein
MGFSSALALCVAIAPAAAHAQSQPQQHLPRLQTDYPEPRTMLPLDRLRGPAPQLSRTTMASYGACVADHSPDKARSLLLADFRGTQYENAMKRLSENNRDCFHRWGSMRFTSLLFAGALAETLMKQDATPLNVRLARAAGGKMPETYGVTDRFAHCVVRSAPDETGALFATGVDTPEEAHALGALDFVVGRCSQGRTMQINPEGLRAALATAAFRNVEAAK